jgi:hypothetical protein
MKAKDIGTATSIPPVVIHGLLCSTDSCGRSSGCMQLGFDVVVAKSDVNADAHGKFGKVEKAYVCAALQSRSATATA